MSRKGNIPKARAYVIEGTIAILLCYFLLGGSEWSPALWAAFAVLAIWIVVMNVRRDASIESAAAYDRWKLEVALLMVLGALGASIWRGSIWLLILSIVLGAVWITDLRSYQAIHRHKFSQENKNGE